MTGQERMNREALLRRAAAVAGAVYVAPAITPADASATAGCKGKCRGEARCNKRGGSHCKCFIKQGKKRGKCSPCLAADTSCSGCGQDGRCPPANPCGDATFCNDSATCICFTVAPAGGQLRDCVEFPSNFCADYPPCNKADGSGCPSGSCCLDTCCPDGICSPACSGVGAAPRTTGRGTTLTL
jgi:hypothetical protein